MDVERSIDIRAPVQDVWAILSDIPGYPRWNRSMQLTLDEEGRDYVAFAVPATTKAGKPYQWRLTGKLGPFREPEQVSWRLGVTGFMLLIMVIDLVPQGGDTRARFQLHVKGLMALFGRRALVGLLAVPIAGALRDLKRAAEGGEGRLRPKAVGKARSKKPRRRFR